MFAGANCATDYLFYPDFGRFCGTAVPAAFPATTVTPFVLTFISDSGEVANEVGTAGFKLDYTQAVC